MLAFSSCLALTASFRFSGKNDGLKVLMTYHVSYDEKIAYIHQELLVEVLARSIVWEHD